MSENKMNDDKIALMLKQHFQQQHEYLEDNGFTNSLMAKLPQKRQLSFWQKFAIYSLPVLLVGLWVLSQLPWQSIIHSSVAFWILADTKDFMMISLAAFFMFILYVGMNFFADSEN